jgi:hypothetical protein
MIPRERLLIIINHHEPDRIPADWGSIHNIMPDAPPESNVAVLEAVNDFCN